MTIERLHLEDLENENHPSECEVGEDYILLILRLPEVRAQKIDILSYAFVVSEGVCYRYDRSRESLESSGTLQQMHTFLDGTLERLIKEMGRYHLHIDDLEESLYDERLPATFMQRWLTYKKEVSLIHRLMFQATIAFELFVRHIRHEETFDEFAYADLLEHMGRIRDLAKAAMEKLDNLYDFYRAKVDERMNRNIYLITILSAVFMPLTLVTGFFGMNTGGLPYTEDPAGTFKVVVITLVLEMLFLVPFLWLNLRRIKKFTREGEA